ncbi:MULTISPECIES: AAA family ATPase [Burkholderia]|uniref:AAA family ATPase n=1 Tax=Burkholderia TaxID=32008 RepID=UPI00075CD337|nr:MULTISPECIES: AAA family ATPase [Burkholderia]AOJ70200.1 fimbrial protein [Burkholderia savannae]AOJ82173.1 fimbrial protein [Burkholderia savannae]KVG42710.1 fimbrial protein [Burkholderia sp. MSMB0265]KVG78364.1 fimbrial protein [Burkholderia sp. MSMB2040]KVG90816.1 fimbrial protein [Burkholderia sp. MSMB2041]
MKVLERRPFKRTAAARTVDFVAVVSDPGSEDVIRRFAQDLAITRMHLQIGQFDDAIRLLQQSERSPRQLVVDISDCAMPVSDLMRLAKMCDPSVRVVAIGTRNDVGLFRNLLGIGVHDYLVKPITVELLRRALTTDEAIAQVRTGKTVSFVGARGGVGTTTIAVCLARCLSDEKLRRVAYVDLNLHGGAANSLLGLSSNNGLTELLQMEQRPDEAFIERMSVAKGDRLSILSAELPYAAAAPVRAGAIADLVDTLKGKYHYVLLDVPVQASELIEDALLASDLVYIVADRSVHAAYECARLVRFAQQLPGERSVSVLLNNPLEPVAGRVQPAEFAQAFERINVRELPHEPQTLAVAENLAEPVGDAKRVGFLHEIRRLADGITGEPMSVAEAWYARFVKWRRGT